MITTIPFTHNSRFNCNCCTASQLWPNVHFANCLHPAHTHTQSVIWKYSEQLIHSTPATKHWILINDWFAFNSFGPLHSPFYTPSIVRSIMRTIAAPAQIAIEYAVQHIFRIMCARRAFTIIAPTPTWLPTVFFSRLRVSATTAAHTLPVYFWPTLPLRLIRIPCRTGAGRCRVFRFHLNCIYTFRGPFLGSVHTVNRTLSNQSWANRTQ